MGLMVIQDAWSSFTVIKIQHHLEYLKNSESSNYFLNIKLDNNILIKKNFCHELCWPF